MIHYRGPEAFYDIAWLVLNQITEDLGAAQVGRVCMYPGNIAWDHCECGMLAGSVGRVFTSDTFPTPSGASNCGGTTLVAELTFAVVRCAPQPGDDPTDPAPSCIDLDVSARQAISDKWTLLSAVGCVLGSLVDGDHAAAPDRGIMDALTQPAVNVGPDGDCVGSQVTALVQIHTGVNT